MQGIRVKDRARVLKLEMVFVDLKISHDSEFKSFNTNPLAVQEMAQARNIWEFLRIKAGAENNGIGLAIVGPPGCGKTTLMQHVAVTLANGRGGKHKAPSYLPIPLALRDHSMVIVVRPEISLAELCQQYYGNAKHFRDLNPPDQWFARQLAKGKTLMLLDGLDEVAELKQQQVMSAWVDKQIRDYPTCRFIVTSRPNGYRTARLERADAVEVQNFSTSQTREFIKDGITPKSSSILVAQRRLEN